MDGRRLEKILISQKKEINKILSSDCKLRYVAKRITGELPLLYIEGVRGSGKTFTTLHALHDKNVSFAYVDLSDQSLYSLNVDGYDSLIESLYMVYDQFDCVVVDEFISHLKWEDFFDACKKNGLKVIAISSEICQTIEEKNILYFYPLSFSEYCLWNEINVDISTPKGRAQIRKAFDNYVVRGGFPTLQKRKNIKLGASEIVKGIVKNDIRGGFRKSKLEEMERIAYTLLDYTVQWVNYKGMAEDFGMQSEITLKKYIEIIKCTGLLYALHRFSLNKKQRNVYEKLYAVDTALIPNDSLQHKLETIVYMQLHRFCDRHGYFIHYYSNRDVDCNFALCLDRKMRTILQVMADYSDSQEIKDKVTGLINLSKLTGCDRLYILTDNQYDMIEERGLSITVVPVYEFLIEHSHKIISE